MRHRIEGNGRDRQTAGDQGSHRGTCSAEDECHGERSGDRRPREHAERVVTKVFDCRGRRASGRAADDPSTERERREGCARVADVKQPLCSGGRTGGGECDDRRSAPPAQLMFAQDAAGSRAPTIPEVRWYLQKYWTGDEPILTCTVIVWPASTS